VRYLRNPEFLDLVLREAIPGLAEVRVPSASVYARIVSTIQNLVAPLAFVGFACLGVLGTWALSWSAAWILATVLDFLEPELGWGFLVDNFWRLFWFLWLGIASAVFFWMPVDAKNRARRSQMEFWGPPGYRSTGDVDVPISNRTTKDGS
jgi:hypothetical protein